MSEDASKKNNDDLIRQALITLANKAVNTGLTKEQFEDILTKVGVNSAEAMKTALKPENTEHPHISAFSYPEGEIKRPKPALKRLTFFNGSEEKADRLTPAEIDGYNALTGRQEARNGKWRSEVLHAGKYNEAVSVTIPCETIDQRMELPPLTLILYELNGGQSTADIQHVIRQLENLKMLAIKQGASVSQLEAALLEA